MGRKPARERPEMANRQTARELREEPAVERPRSHQEGGPQGLSTTALVIVFLHSNRSSDRRNLREKGFTEGERRRGRGLALEESAPGDKFSLYEEQEF